ncbi:FOG: Toll/interleukin receptor and related proteins containing LRR and TIR repeats [Plasmopara halstedii]|uniref:FOG: Toll/interleukin receptor and related proteins containing LRR and TIR repeats n=1 Tax=Plasmopara halstedii TaxID=4781 RepID=A0A0P1ANY0_PLAHL|nr:FOG: Toll/interleukin receptor and related proteins containing LRR and TIR repeats [Plasmopara halstedii]CEG42981.1 FOG: Toll/interleukin receptor and related proteins containing LRR and TIR repeats [Plasmopara halstedii]|eukprot:XP_024579350.1 FOG: Toll/interleukin receptor and related proteins containing LRR and TIR repeats [Plasmopara halstedii]
MYIRHTSTSVIATSLRDIARLGSCVLELNLSNSNDLVCHQLMCEHLGDACSCRLALALERVPCLQRLDLSKNQLRALPDALFALQSLKTLNIQHNRLTTLSTDVYKLMQLETLDVRYNHLTTLPVEYLETLENLETLRVKGNDKLIHRLQDRQLNLSDKLKTKIVLD